MLQDQADHFHNTVAEYVSKNKSTDVLEGLSQIEEYKGKLDDRIYYRGKYRVQQKVFKFRKEIEDQQEVWNEIKKGMVETFDFLERDPATEDSYKLMIFLDHIALLIEVGKKEEAKEKCEEWQFVYQKMILTYPWKEEGQRKNKTRLESYKKIIGEKNKGFIDADTTEEERSENAGDVLYDKYESTFQHWKMATIKEKPDTNRIYQRFQEVYKIKTDESYEKILRILNYEYKEPDRIDIDEEQSIKENIDKIWEVITKERLNTREEGKASMYCSYAWGIACIYDSLQEISMNAEAEKKKCEWICRALILEAQTIKDISVKQYMRMLVWRISRSQDDFNSMMDCSLQGGQFRPNLILLYEYCRNDKDLKEKFEQNWGEYVRSNPEVKKKVLESADTDETDLAEIWDAPAEELKRFWGALENLTSIESLQSILESYFELKDYKWTKNSSAEGENEKGAWINYDTEITKSLKRIKEEMQKSKATGDDVINEYKESADLMRRIIKKCDNQPSLMRLKMQGIFLNEVYEKVIITSNQYFQNNRPVIKLLTDDVVMISRESEIVTIEIPFQKEKESMLPPTEYDSYYMIGDQEYHAAFTGKEKEMIRITPVVDPQTEFLEIGIRVNYSYPWSLTDASKKKHFDVAIEYKHDGEATGKARVDVRIGSRVLEDEDEMISTRIGCDFASSNIVNPDEIKIITNNRKTEINEVKRFLKKSFGWLVMIGQWRVGKTSILRRIEAEERSREGAIVAFCELPGANLNQENLVRELFVSGIGNEIKRKRETIPDVWEKWKECFPEKWDQCEHDLTGGFKAFEEFIGGAGRLDLIVIVDEFSRVYGAIMDEKSDISWDCIAAFNDMIRRTGTKWITAGGEPLNRLFIERANVKNVTKMTVSNLDKTAVEEYTRFVLGEGENDNRPVGERYLPGRCEDVFQYIYDLTDGNPNILRNFLERVVYDIKDSQGKVKYITKNYLNEVVEGLIGTSKKSSRSIEDMLDGPGFNDWFYPMYNPYNQGTADPLFIDRLRLMLCVVCVAEEDSAKETNILDYCKKNAAFSISDYITVKQDLLLRKVIEERPDEELHIRIGLFFEIAKRCEKKVPGILEKTIEYYAN